MEREVASLEKGAVCCAWNYCGQRIAVGHIDGSVSIHDSHDYPAAPSSSSKWKAHSSSVVKVVWTPPECGDAIACICEDGKFSLWEEIDEDTQCPTWKLCKLFENSGSHVLELQFGVFVTNLKMVAAYSYGHVKVYELMDPLNLDKWQLQAEFQNVLASVSRFGKASCKSASIAWNPHRIESQQSSFVLGFSSDQPQLNSSKIWVFEEAHQRWVSVAELALPEDDSDRVHAVAWAPNIGRPFEIIAVATSKAIAIWHVVLDPESDGRLPTEKVALLEGHDGEVWQLEWDMSGMTLASTGSDGIVRLWQSNMNGVWHEQTVLDCNVAQS
ncbi:protein SEH1-like [Zingiber officinale]|uniref:protein SEH1-like n=1 Tax=Zingiber officinale TaxID=94328 RepID=UPI001C4B1A0E|nr:protein SEH1-like [Zingiber officinale]XP_042431130.1 protein SEH1-like [Zingiber officinale]